MTNNRHCVARDARLILDEPSAPLDRRRHRGAATAAIADAPLEAAVSCPAAQIGLQLAAASAQFDQLDGSSARGPDALEQTQDLMSHLMADLSWVVPKSMEGLLVLSLAIYDAAEDTLHRAAGGMSEAECRRMVRLAERLIEGLSTVGAQTPSGIGLGHFWSGAAVSAPVRDRSNLR